MSNEKILEIIDNYAKVQFANECTGHDYQHVLRVQEMAVFINKYEKGNEFIIRIIALLHDVFDHKFYNGNNTISKEITNLLYELKLLNYFSKDALKNILNSCENIGYTANKDKKNKLSLEGKIVQDADRLDAMGAIGIARAFAYGGKVGNLIYDSVNEETSTTIKHFYDKLLKLKNLMNTNTGKKIAINRHKYMENFLKEFYQEINHYS